MFRFTSLVLLTSMVTSVASSPSIAATMNGKNSRKEKMISKLVEKARHTENSQISRRMDGADDISLSGYEIKFQKCQSMKAYDEEKAEDESASNVLSHKRFVVFRLCPSGTCPNACSSGYGEYVVDLDTYIEVAAAYFENEREQICNLCDNVCYADDDAVKNKASKYVDCDSCSEYCEFVENMDNQGYADSYQFAQCVQVYQDDNGNQIYAGAMCSTRSSSSSSGIVIGAFSDEDCSVYESNADVTDFMENGVKLYDDIFEKMSDSGNCVSCVANDYDGDDYNVEENEFCSEIHESAAKCESKHGFDNYWKDYEQYANQYVQEDAVCDFIDSLSSGTYDQYGEITVSGTIYSGNAASGGQKFLMMVFGLGAIGATLYALSLQAKLKATKTDLSAQGGALA